MAAQVITIESGKLLNLVCDTDAAPLAQSDCKALPIVEILPSGRIEIVDGYHRIAGMIAAGETAINCVVCDDEQLVCDAANNEQTASQRAAIESIYSQVK